MSSITNVRNSPSNDGTKDYLFVNPANPNGSWVSEVSLKVSNPDAVKDFKRRVKAKKEEKERKARGEAPPLPPTSAPPPASLVSATVPPSDAAPPADADAVAVVVVPPAGVVKGSPVVASPSGHTTYLV